MQSSQRSQEATKITSETPQGGRIGTRLPERSPRKSWRRAGWMEFNALTVATGFQTFI